LQGEIDHWLPQLLAECLSQKIERSIAQNDIGLFRRGERLMARFDQQGFCERDEFFQKRQRLVTEGHQLSPRLRIEQGLWISGECLEIDTVGRGECFKRCVCVQSDLEARPIQSVCQGYEWLDIAS